MESFHIQLLFTSHLICLTLSAPQLPEINDQFVSTTTQESRRETVDVTNLTTTTERENHQIEEKENRNDTERRYFKSYTEVANVETNRSFVVVIYETLTKPIVKFVTSPKVNYVLKNVGTCLVNGVMELISYYFPAPVIPLIASAAGMVIPFEPVVMLKEKMPVTSYRRAFRKAMNSFLNTFDGYKLDNYDDDPYMTRRFNRRFMNDISDEKKKKLNEVV